MKNAVASAMALGCHAVTCGHTHFPEDRVYKGIRYINTGAWTEYPPHCLLVTDRKMILSPIHDAAASEYLT